MSEQPAAKTLCILPGNETIRRTSDSVVVSFPGRRHVVSTSWMNGGYREDLTAVFNHHISPDAGSEIHEGRRDILQYLSGVASSTGIDPETATGLVTAADMGNTVIITESARDLAVSAIVTAGIDVNGCRAGDPASYYEENGRFTPLTGTINTIIVIQAALPGYSLLRAVITASEAKAAALQALMAPSRYSSGIATGSGTDMTAVVSDPDCPLVLTDAGTHSALGELIARSVIRATTTALERETGLSARSQMDPYARLRRFDRNMRFSGGNPGQPAGAGDPGFVAVASAVLHLADEAAWGLLPDDVAVTAAVRIIDATIRGTGRPAVPLPAGPAVDVIPRELAGALFERRDQVGNQ